MLEITEDLRYVNSLEMRIKKFDHSKKTFIS